MHLGNTGFGYIKKTASRLQKKRVNKIKKILNEGEPDPSKETWEKKYHRNLVKLASMILLYVYSNDDGKVTRKELRHIKKLNKQEESYLNKNDLIEIVKLAKERLTLSSFLKYIELNQYKETIFMEACDRAKKNIIKNAFYYNILEELKEEFRRYVS